MTPDRTTAVVETTTHASLSVAGLPQVRERSGALWLRLTRAPATWVALVVAASTAVRAALGRMVADLLGVRISWHVDGVPLRERPVEKARPQVSVSRADGGPVVGDPDAVHSGVLATARRNARLFGIGCDSGFASARSCRSSVGR